ncbi:CCA tRNA nucleotidyltransferase [uncultured Clostridium sp.]|uniref:CCA tRNA nucleotidyltransferase n=1 Tax=uncultured Clostridium sp. TaxID=59620 RepID=UPI0025CECE6B|nr:CCA tRNA nucleotidyltransferase [uncultured Clostridium sp.]
MIPKRIEMPVQVEEILGKLREHGYEAFAVGGCVRDAILGRIPGDWDITTSAHPEEVKQVFGHTIDTGLQHGTVTVMRDHIGYEITTYRIDGEYEDGRHPKEVVFTAELREDLRRRDFTINAMAYSHETGIVDIFGGTEDLAARRIRCVGDAGERFTEDALRILRAVRFSAQLGFSIEEMTWQALCELAPSLVHVSKERVQVELTKTLLSDRPEYIWKTEAAGLAPYISKTFPEVFAAWKERKRISGAAAHLPAEKALRWAYFLAPAGEESCVRVLRELKMDNDTIDKAKILSRFAFTQIEPEEVSVRRAMSAMEDMVFDWLLLLQEVLMPERMDAVEMVRSLAKQIRERSDCIRLKTLAVTGKDLIQAGIQPGPALGKTLHLLFEKVLENPAWNEKDRLLTEVEVLKQSQNAEISKA